MKECENYFDGFCLKDIDAARVWDCTAPTKILRIAICQKWQEDYTFSCPYPKLGKD